MKKWLIALLISPVLTLGIAYASPQVQTQINHHDTMTFQIIKSQFSLKKKDFQSISIVKNTDKYAIEVQLTTQAAKLMMTYSAKNIGQAMNTVWHHHILNTATIRSSLGGQFLMTGLTKRQAKSIVESLSHTK